MVTINSDLLKDVVYNLCLKAGQELSKYPYEKILKAYKRNKSAKLARILQNAEKAKNIQRPLCQDTGTVHVFLKIGNEVSFSSNPIDAINEGVKKCYTEKFFRKSIVENEFISGKNLETNTPALINIEYVNGNFVEINILLKGAGCDNVSEIQMLLPTIQENELVDFIANKILEKGQNACPPLFVSVAMGTGAESVMTEAEKGYFKEKSDLPEIRDKIYQKVCENADKKYENFYLADLKLTAKPHHMASLPIAIAFNCHSLRIASACIKDDKIIYSDTVEIFEKITPKKEKLKEINVNDREELKNLKEGEEVLLTGKILIARDAAHKRMLEYKKQNKKMPFDLKDSVIFYAAPCSSAPKEIVGPIGPTTASRMDKFLKEFPEISATLGKGNRSKEAADFIRKNHSVYFEIEGGIATLLSSCFKKYEVIAFKDLSTEAVSLAYVEKLPAKVSISEN
ncbi:fumarate hydratase [bacterium]|nr:fumarate hydratase [bacterium]